jgi:hypothetical protein
MAAVLVFCTPLATRSQDGKPKPPPGIQLKLTISVEEYDPFDPSKGSVKCVMVNRSAEPIRVSLGYDGKTNLLKAHGQGHSHEVQLYPLKRTKAEPKQIEIKPGEEAVVYELSLDEILFQGVRGDPRKNEDRTWGWGWIARPESPPSPIHRWRKEGFLETASFWAEIAIGRQKVTSEKVTLKVKAKTQAEK